MALQKRPLQKTCAASFCVFLELFRRWFLQSFLRCFRVQTEKMMSFGPCYRCFLWQYLNKIIIYSWVMNYIIETFKFDKIEKIYIDESWLSNLVILFLRKRYRILYHSKVYIFKIFIIWIVFLRPDPNIY